MRFFEVDTAPETKWIGLADANKKYRDILINNTFKGNREFHIGSVGYGTLTHEMLHTLGLSHPGSHNSDDPKMGGDNPKYSQNGTAMSYNFGGCPPGLAPYDVLALQQFYGPANPTSRRKSVISGAELAKTTVLWSGPEPMTLDLRNFMSKPGHEAAHLFVNMESPNFNQQIGGYIYNGEDVPTSVGVRLVPGTRIKEVLADETTEASLNITGDAHINVLCGGSKDDLLQPRGGGDILTGGGGRDYFVLSSESGRGNRITDFTPDVDKLRIFKAKTIRIRQTENGKDVEVAMKDAAGNVTASAILENYNAKMSQLLRSIEFLGGIGDKSVHPSGLPNAVKLPKDNTKGR